MFVDLVFGVENREGSFSSCKRKDELLEDGLIVVMMRHDQDSKLGFINICNTYPDRDRRKNVKKVN